MRLSAAPLHGAGRVRRGEKENKASSGRAPLPPSHCLRPCRRTITPTAHDSSFLALKNGMRTGRQNGRQVEPKSRPNGGPRSIQHWQNGLQDGSRRRLFTKTADLHETLLLVVQTHVRPPQRVQFSLFLGPKVGQKPAKSFWAKIRGVGQKSAESRPNVGQMLFDQIGRSPEKLEL